MGFLEKFRPASITLVRLITTTSKFSNENKKRFTKNVFSQSLKEYTSVFTIVASCAFLWPIKKNKQPVTNVNVDRSQAIIQNADQLFENGHYEESYNILSQHEDYENLEVQWRLVRALYNMSKESKYNKDRQKECIYLAHNIISDLLIRHEENNIVQKWYALILDTKSAYEGIKERIKQLENVKKHMDLAVTLNPEDATSLHMLGEWCYQITEMPWHQRKIAEVLFASPPHSTYEDALEYFLKAEAAEPRFYSMNLLRIGNCYLKLKKDDQAKYYLKLAASYPAKSNDDHQANKEAAELLKKII